MKRQNGRNQQLRRLLSLTVPIALYIGAVSSSPAIATFADPNTAPVNPGGGGAVQVPINDLPGNQLPNPAATTGGVPGGDLSILNGDLEAILGNGDLGSILGGDLGSILGGDLGSILGGDLGGLLGGSGDLGGIFGDGTNTVGGSLGGLLGDLGGLGGIFGDGSNQVGDLGGILGGLGGLGGGGGGADIDLALPSLADSFGSWTTLATSAADGITNNLLAGFQGAPTMIVGALGVPDVLASQAALQQAVASGSSAGSPLSAQGADRFNVNPQALGNTLGKELSRAASVGFSNTLLSEQGQQAIQEEVAAADETLTGIVDTATAAQELDVTQDVMKQMAVMDAQAASLDVAAYGQTIQLRQQIAADALVQSEAAEELSALNRRANAEQMAGAADVLQSSSTLLMF